MSEESSQNLPEKVANSIAGIPKALIPNSVKALDRLVGVAIDIPVAWLNQQKAKIDAKTKSIQTVEEAIGQAAARIAATDDDTVQNAVGALVRKEYRKQLNREAVATAMISELHSSDNSEAEQDKDRGKEASLDEDWLNVFERYAEDASTERMQNLWGRVLAGEVRKPGRYSMRTLRFLSEFSQADGLTFADFCLSAFGDWAPASLVKPEDRTDIRDLIYLESSGLIQGASGLGLTITINFNDSGNGFLREGNLLVVLQGSPNEQQSFPVCALTPLGQELLSLLPGRDVRAAARRVAHALRVPAIKAALLATLGENGKILPMEVLWQEVQNS